MDFGTLELLITAVAATLLALAGWTRLQTSATRKALDAERAARAALEVELRNDIAAERAESQKLRTRVVELETAQAREKQALIEAQEELRTVRGQVGVLLAEMSALQQKVRELKEELDAARDREAQLEREAADLRAARSELARENHDLQQAVATYERALTLLGIERAEAAAHAERAGPQAQAAGDGAAQTTRRRRAPAKTTETQAKETGEKP